MPIVDDYTSILAYLDHGSYRWNAESPLGTGVVVSYSFLDPGELPSVGDQSYSVTSVGAFTAAQRASFRDAVAVFEAAANVRFVEVDGGDAMIDVYRVEGSAWGGWGSYPSVGSGYTSQGNHVIDASAGTSFDKGAWQWSTLLHELGHNMGLSHTHDGNLTLVDRLDDVETTVMSYEGNGRLVRGLGPLDLDALTHLYGAPATLDSAAIRQLDSGVFRIVLTGRADAVVGLRGDNLILGRKGSDYLAGREGDDVIRGGGGNDTIDGMDGADRLFGGAGADILRSGYSGWGDVVLKGGSGNDSLVGGSASNRMIGGAGADDIQGGDWDDIIRGGGGGDRLDGGGYSDILDGGAGSDRLFGGEGNDTLAGGQGRDILSGGAGYDSFVFTRADKGRMDSITDFDLGVDRIDASTLGLTIADARVATNGSGGSILKFEGVDLSVELESVGAAEVRDYYGYYF